MDVGQPGSPERAAIDTWVTRLREGPRDDPDREAALSLLKRSNLPEVGTWLLDRIDANMVDHVMERDRESGRDLRVSLALIDAICTLLWRVRDDSRAAGVLVRICKAHAFPEIRESAARGLGLLENVSAIHALLADQESSG